MSRLPSAVRGAAWLVLVLCLSGCSRSYPQNESVEGTVTLNGVPVPNAVVQFVPDVDSNAPAPTSSASTDEKGFFRLMCDNKKPGAVVAKHSVVILPGRQATAADAVEGKELPRVKIAPVPSIYGTAAKTPLKIEVTADKHTYDLPLTTKSANEGDRPR